MTWRSPDTYQTAGLRRGDRHFKFHDGRGNLLGRIVLLEHPTVLALRVEVAQGARLDTMVLEEGFEVDPPNADPAELVGRQLAAVDERIESAKADAEELSRFGRAKPVVTCCPRHGRIVRGLQPAGAASHPPWDAD